MQYDVDIIVTRIREVSSGVKTAELARILGMTQQTVDCYMRGKRKPSLELVYNVCSKFGCSADWLLGLNDEKQEDVIYTPDKTEALKSAIQDVLNRF